MKYTIPFNLSGKESKIYIDYEKISSAQASGFTALKLPFDVFCMKMSGWSSESMLCLWNDMIFNLGVELL